jgi:hypothetical protein
VRLPGRRQPARLAQRQQREAPRVQPARPRALTGLQEQRQLPERRREWRMVPES